MTINPSRPDQLKIAIVAGEKSGDDLGGPLMASLNKLHTDISFIGVGGNKMSDEGLSSFFSLERIAVMGIIEPLLKLRELLSLRRKLNNFLLKEKPDIFIGIDSPDFNLPIAKFLKKELGIKTVQYVSPSVWAWRKGRIKSMEKSIDTVITLFPFEGDVYKESKVNTCYVGHPLAYKLNGDINKKESEGENIDIALLPGSRRSEIVMLADEMIKAAKVLKEKNSNYKFHMPLSDKNHLSLIKESLNEVIEISFNNSQEILSKCKMAVITSGTATLEALLLRTPCVTVYKTNWLSYKIIKPLLRIDYFSLPNLLYGGVLTPELLQDDVTSKNIIEGINSIEKKGLDYFVNEFDKIHSTLKAGGSETAAKEVYDLLN